MNAEDLVLNFKKGMANLSKTERRRAIESVRDVIRAAAFDDRTSVAAWKQKPSWYLVASDDRMIVPQMQRDFAKKIGAQTTEVAASHVPQQSRPGDVAKVIIQAVEKTQAAR